MNERHKGEKGEPMSVVEKYGDNELPNAIIDSFGTHAASKYFAMIADRQRETDDSKLKLFIQELFLRNSGGPIAFAS